MYDRAEKWNLLTWILNLWDWRIQNRNSDWEYNLQTGDGDAGAVKWTVQTLKNYFEDKGEA